MPAVTWLFAFALLSGALSRVSAQLPAPPVSGPRLLHAGGYAGAAIGVRPQSGDVEVLNGVAAALISGTLLPRVTYFAEVEAASRTLENQTGIATAEGVEFERLYGEVTLSDQLRVRLGRFFTPVGQWNEQHADPLTWTPLRPLTTYRPFAKSTTGVLLAGQLPFGNNEFGYAAYGAPWQSREEEDEASFIRAFGGRIVVELGTRLTLGMSGSEFRASRPHEEEEDSLEFEHHEDEEGDEREDDVAARRLLGVDLLANLGPVRLQAEATHLTASATRPAERGVFVQLVTQIKGPLYLVGRAEYYDPVPRQSLSTATLGLTLRPSTHFTFKTAWQWTDRTSRRVSNGWLFSASALF